MPISNTEELEKAMQEFQRLRDAPDDSPDGRRRWNSMPNQVLRCLSGRRWGKWREWRADGWRQRHARTLLTIDPRLGALRHDYQNVLRRLATMKMAPSDRREWVSESPILVYDGVFEGVNHGQSKLVSLSQDLHSGLAPR